MYSAVQKFQLENNEVPNPTITNILCVIIYLNYNSLPLSKKGIFDTLSLLGLISDKAYCYTCIDRLHKDNYINPLGKLEPCFKLHTYTCTIKFQSLFNYVSSHFDKMVANIETNKRKKQDKRTLNL